MERWTGPQEHESDSIKQRAPFKLRAMSLDNRDNSLFWKLNLFCWKAWAGSWTMQKAASSGASCQQLRFPDSGARLCKLWFFSALGSPQCRIYRHAFKWSVSESNVCAPSHVFLHPNSSLLSKPVLLFLPVRTLTSQLCHCTRALWDR